MALLETSYASRNIGDIFFTLRKDATLNGAVPCNGTEYSSTDFISGTDDYNPYMLIANGKIPSVNYVEYEAQIKATGNCASFGYDSASGKFKVPTLNEVFVEAGDGATLAKYIAPGIPDHMHFLVNDTYTSNNKGLDGYLNKRTAYGGHDAEYWLSTSSNDPIGGWTDKASRHNSLYKTDLQTVQPPAIILRPMVQLVVVGYFEEGEDTGGQTYRVPYTFVPGTEAKALAVNANFDYVTRMLSEALRGSSVVHIDGTETIVGKKTFSSNVSTTGIELIPGVTASHGGYVDFHYGGSTADFTARLIEAVRGYLSINQSPPSGDNSTKIATTAWVKALVGSNPALSYISSINYSGATNGSNYFALYSDSAKTNRVFLIQFGYVSTGGVNKTVTFPTAFTKASAAVCTTNRTSGGKYGFNHTYSLTTTSVGLCRDNGPGWWIAIGK